MILHLKIPTLPTSQQHCPPINKMFCMVQTTHLLQCIMDILSNMAAILALSSLWTSQ